MCVSYQVVVVCICVPYTLFVSARPAPAPESFCCILLASMVVHIFLATVVLLFRRVRQGPINGNRNKELCHYYDNDINLTLIERLRNCPSLVTMILVDILQCKSCQTLATNRFCAFSQATCMYMWNCSTCQPRTESVRRFRISRCIHTSYQCLDIILHAWPFLHGHGLQSGRKVTVAETVPNKILRKPRLVTECDPLRQDKTALSG